MIMVGLHLLEVGLEVVVDDLGGLGNGPLGDKHGLELD
jgi:hypothetical protein